MVKKLEIVFEYDEQEVGNGRVTVVNKEMTLLEIMGCIEIAKFQTIDDVRNQMALSRYNGEGE